MQIEYSRKQAAVFHMKLTLKVEPPLSSNAFQVKRQYWLFCADIEVASFSLSFRNSAELSRCVSVQITEITHFSEFLLKKKLSLIWT